MTLAGSLRVRDDASLERLLTLRPPAPRGRVRDFFDLAESLLEVAGIRSALQRLDRHTLAVLSAATADSLTATELADRIGSMSPDQVEDRAALAVESALLIRTETGYSALGPVSGLLADWPKTGLPDLAELATSPPPPAGATPSAASARSTDLSAADHAFQSTMATAELVVELLSQPVRELGKGGPALPERRRLARAMQVEEPAVDSYLDLAVRSNLASHETGGWHPTETGEKWLSSSTAERWAVLARAWVQAIPGEVRSVLGARTEWGESLHSYARWLYPAGGEWLHGEVDRVAAHAELLGVTSGPSPAAQVLSTPGAALLTADADTAAAAMAHLFPAHVAQVYLQHDLSIIAPGPLQPDLDQTLRGFADLENRAQAFSYRLSQASINRALSSGVTARQMLAFLESISLTGIPQPVHYLISQAAGRFGTIRVGTVPSSAGEPDAHSYVRSSDSALIGLLQVDQALSSLGLRRSGDNRLVSRFEFEVVFWALSDARYPVAAETPDGALISLRRQRTTHTPVAQTAPDHSELIASLRSAQFGSPEDSRQAWVARLLDAAIRAKQTVTVTVQVPNSGPLEFVLEPTGVSGGRLRGRDKRSDIERTLPLSSILELK